MTEQDREVHTQINHWGDPNFIERWMIAPPAFGISYQVVREEWNDDFTVRTIHEIKVA